MKKIIKLLILSSVIFSACKNNDDNKTVLAEVYGNKLYLSDIKDLMNENLSTDDSLAIINDKINMWVRTQTMLHQAEKNLDQQQKDVESIVQDYKATLLIDRYKEEILKQKLDTVVTEQQIYEYYKDFASSFKLNKDIVKAQFFKFSTNTQDIFEFRRNFFSESDQNYQKTVNFAKANAVKYDDFGKKWIAFSEISSLLPTSISNPEVILKSTDKIQTQDNDFYYFVRIYDYKLKDEQEPVENVKEQITLIIINKRKVDLIGELEKVIYDKAVDNGDIKIYN